MSGRRLQHRIRRARGLVVARQFEGGQGLQVTGGLRISRPAPETRIVVGDRVILYHDVALFLDRPGATIVIGDRTYLNRRCEINCFERVAIGADCAIGWDVQITDSDYHHLDGDLGVAPVSIGERVWIGARSTVLKGVTVGDGAVVAAGSLVTRNVPARALVAGTPARVVREGVTWSP